MRPHGRAIIDPSSPKALGICDRCGFRYQHQDLRWQYDWRGPKLQNLRFLVCQSCIDKPQMNGQRTIILPQDPVPVMNARPEFNVPDNNPLSGIGGDPLASRWQYGSFIGTLTEGGGPQSAFDTTVNKIQTMSAMISTPLSSYNNYVGVNWTGYYTTVIPSSIGAPVRTHSLMAFTATAPNNATFGSTAYVVQGSPVDAGWGSWTTLASGTPAGTVGEVLTGTIGGQGLYQFHRLAFYGGSSPISVAQVAFSVNEVSSNSQSR